MDVTIRRSSLMDCRLLAPLVRDEDRLEVVHAGSRDIVEALEDGFYHSDLCFSVVEEGNIVMMYGVAPSKEDVMGHVWLLSSDIVTRKPITFLRNSKLMLDQLHLIYPVLSNLVWETNKVHVKWLRWLGFKMINRVTLNGEPFLEFVRLKCAVQ